MGASFGPHDIRHHLEQLALAENQVEGGAHAQLEGADLAGRFPKWPRSY